MAPPYTQLLSELCELGLPFSAVLAVIRDELVRSIYSDHFLSRDGSLTFDQVRAAQCQPPWQSTPWPGEDHKTAPAHGRCCTTRLASFDIRCHRAAARP